MSLQWEIPENFSCVCEAVYSERFWKAFLVELMRLLLLRKFVCDFDLGDIGNVGQSVGFDFTRHGLSVNVWSCVALGRPAAPRGAVKQCLAVHKQLLQSTGDHVVFLPKLGPRTHRAGTIHWWVQPPCRKWAARCPVRYPLATSWVKSLQWET